MSTVSLEGAVHHPLGVGSTVWVFDDNHRIYPRAADGKREPGARPIWREYWRPRRITAETRVSWVIGGGFACDAIRIPKRIERLGLRRRGFAFSEAEILEREWVHEHKHAIVDAVRSAVYGERLDMNQLKQIAAIVGWAPE